MLTQVRVWRIMAARGTLRNRKVGRHWAAHLMRLCTDVFINTGPALQVLHGCDGNDLVQVSHVPHLQSASGRLSIQVSECGGDKGVLCNVVLTLPGNG